ncbi:hypothetical protein, partial [Subtercola sp. RTI3]|uniref:hypothetical protein n=1 Tax=Subtercola sp. RTI3 TaxID=3048639 RepID=UPI002B232379
PFQSSSGSQAREIPRQKLTIKCLRPYRVIYVESWADPNIVVPSTVIIERMGFGRAPVGSFAPHTDAAYAYSELWVRIQSMIKARQRKHKH